jgi:RHS repeat-associated protein
VKNFIRGIGMLVFLAASGAVHATTEWNAKEYDLYSGDFNGDGKTDILYIAKDPSMPSGIALSDSTGAPNIAWQSWPSNFLNINWSGNAYNVIIGDFNADGKADIFLQSVSPTGNSFLLLTSTAGFVVGISEVIPPTYLTITGWTADQHRIVAGAFTGSVNGHPKADLFLQATSPSGTNYVVLSDTNGTFSTAPEQSWSDSGSPGGFKWSTQNANVYAGDFNGDGYADLLIQAKPNFVMIDYDVPFPVPTYPPNMNGIVPAHTSGTIFTGVGVQAWSRMSNGVDWSSLSNNIVVGINGTGPAMVVLQAKYSGKTSYELVGNATGAIFPSAATALSSNVNLSADSYHLITGNFGGGAGVGLYYQTLTSGGTNYITDGVGATITASVQALPSPTTAIQPTTAAGRTDGHFAVSLTGGATYNIPIETPPGVGDVQLTLALNYNSVGVNGVLGMGWGISGLSAIARCAKTYAQDGAPGPITLQLSSTYSDRFCLDGKQLKLANSSVNYGYANSTYATEIESFSLIKAGSAMVGNGPASFTVTTKNGLVYSYGGTSDSEILAGTSGTIRAWALSQIADRAGNKISLTYQQSSGSYRIDHILYPTTASGVGPFYEVLFQYDARPGNDILSGYIAGYSVSETNQLNSIEILEYPSGNIIKQYNIAYTQSTSTNRNTLTAVQECSASTCLAPTSINYQVGATGWSNTATVTSSTNQPFTFADINGDGLPDLVYIDNSSKNIFVQFATSSGWGPPTNTNTGLSGYAIMAVGSFLGNGAQQVVVSQLGTAGPIVVLSYNASSGTFSSTPTGLITTYTPAVSAADIDGDGLDDLIVVYAGVLQALHNTTVSPGAVKFGSPVTIWTPPTGQLNVVPGGRYRPFADGGVRIADFNGDGRADLLAVTTNSSGNAVYVTPLISNGATSPFTALTTFQFNVPQNSGTTAPIITDWNGDGCTDVITPDLSYSHVLVELSNCAGGFTQLQTTLVPGAATSLSTADWNGDGRQDLLYNAANGSPYVLLSTGTGQGSNIALSTPPFSNGYLPSLVVDGNGDGLPDLVFANANGSFTYYLHNGVSTPPDLAISFTDGFGMNQSPTYVPLTNTAYYSIDTGASFPEMDYVGATYVVNQFTATDGTGSTYQDQFHYDGARFNAQGRGFEGFNFKRTYDSRNALYTYDYQQRSFPYTGMPYQQIVSNGTHNVHEWTATPNTQTVAGLGGYQTRWFPYLSPETTTLWETGGTKDGQQISQSTKTSTYGDGYGNLTQAVISTTDQDSTSPVSPFNGLTWTRTINASYYNDTAHNCFGLPNGVSDQSAVPGQTTQTRTYSHSADTTYCRTTQKTIEPNVSGQQVTTVYGFDTCGNVSSVAVTGENPDGSAMATRTTTYNYVYVTSRCQLPEYVTNALGQNTTIAYNYDFGRPTSVADPNNLMTSWVQDDYGRNVRETRPDGTYSTTTFASCSSGPCWGVSDLRFQSVTSDYGSDTSFINQRNLYYDGFIRLREDESYRANGFGNPTVWNIDAIHAYDSLGRQTQLTRPYSVLSNGYMQWSYDALNRPTSARLYQPNGTLDRTTGTQYLGRTRKVTDPRSNTVAYVTDVTGSLRQVIDPAPGGTTQYAYDAFGNLNQTIDAIGATSGATYNLRGFQTQMVDADAGIWNFEGDSLNELASWIDAKSQTFSATYDALGRIRTQIEPEGTSTWTWGSTASLHNIGELQSVTGYGYTENLFYDNAGRLSSRSLTSDQTYQYGYTYNSIGKLARVSYPTSPIPTGTTAANFTIQYAYVAGEPVQIQDITNSTAIQLWQSNSNTDAGLPATETIGAGAAAVSITTSYKVWTDEILSIQSGTGSSTTNVQSLGYVWDTTGNLTQRGDANQSGTCAVNGVSLKLCEIFTPDALNRLSTSTLNGVSNLSVGYNAAGDITSRSDVGSGAWTYPSPTAPHPHGVTAAGTNSYSYDANGNVLTKNGLTFTWASYNLPTYLQSTQSGTTLTSQFLYGPEHKRYQQVASFTDGTETTQYVGDALEKMTASSTGLTYWRHYVVTPSGHHIVMSRNSDYSTSKAIVLDDHLGSSDAVVNGLTGALIIQESFNPFGLRRQSNWTAGISGSWYQTAITQGTRRGFTSHEELDGIGLIHMNGRVYDPTIGRFMSVDPIVGDIRNSQARNPYSYVANRPLVSTDPTGLCPACQDAGGQGGLGLGTDTPAAPTQLPNGSSAGSNQDMQFANASTAQQRVAAPPPQAQLPEQVVEGSRERAPSLEASRLDAEQILREGAEFQKQSANYREELAHPPPSAVSAMLKEIVVSAEKTGKIAAEVAVAIAPIPGLEEVGAAKLLEEIVVTARAGKAAKAVEKASTLKPGPFARESIPGHRGRLSAEEQRKINEINSRNGCHTCGTKDAGTKSGNAVGDHQPPQALGDPTDIYPHCIDCMRRQGGEVLQELLKRGQQ